MKYEKRLRWAKKLYNRENTFVLRVGKIYITNNRKKFYIYYGDGARSNGLFYSRFKMEIKLGSRLPEWKETHHEDGNTLNDKYSNLRIISDSEHTRLTHKGLKRSKETRRKISASTIGRESPRLGIKLSEDIKRKISESRRGKYCGKKHHMFGKSLWSLRKQKVS